MILRSLKLVALIALVVSALTLPACGRDADYSQDTPDDVLKSALAMVKNGDARLLGRLLDDGGSKDMRAVLNRLGRLTGSLQELAKTVAERFPDDVAKLKTQVAEEAQGEKGQQALEVIMKGPGSPAARKGPPTQQEQDQQRAFFEGTFARLMADPFSFLEQAAGRLSTQRITDDQAAIMLDEKPVPPVGLTMRLRDGKWYIELPLNLPGVSQYLPQTHTEHQIVASLIKVFDNTVKDLTETVRTGGVASINQLAEKAGERAFVPAGMVMLVYVKEMDVRRQRERAVRDFNKRLADWTKARAEDAEILRGLGTMLTRVAVEELDKAVRSHVKDNNVKVPRFEGISDADLLTTMQGWLNGRRVGLALAGPISAADLEKAIAAVDASLGQIASARKK